MRIINPQVKKDLDEGKPIKIDLGSGGKGPDGFYSLDHLDLEGIDIVADLNETLSLLPDNCVEAIRSNHALEHISSLLPLMREIHRITRPDGHIEIIVPHFSNVYGFSDPTHVRFFGLYTMYYFVSPEEQPGKRKVPSFYTDTRFGIDSVQLEFYRSGFVDKVFAPIFSRLFNASFFWQNVYERRLSGLFHAKQIRYIMHPKK